MKIFGFYLFEEDPELIKLRESKEKREREGMAIACKNSTRKHMNFDCPVLPWPPESLFEDSVITELKYHRKCMKKNECHWFNHKIYCYHTGKEIIYDK